MFNLILYRIFFKSDTDILNLPKSNTIHTTSFGLHLFKYQAVKHWNSLLDSFRQSTILSISDFRNKIRKLNFSLLNSFMY
jgi:hypothetical protein